MAAAGTGGDQERRGAQGRVLYFCGSIRGGRQDQALYARIVSRLRRFGVVLTEHVAAAELDEHGDEGLGVGPGKGAGPLSLRLPKAAAPDAVCRRGPGFLFYCHGD